MTLDLRNVSFEMEIIPLRDYLADQPMWPDEIQMTHAQYNSLGRSITAYETVAYNSFKPMPIDFGFKNPPVKVLVKDK